MDSIDLRKLEAINKISRMGNLNRHLAPILNFFNNPLYCYLYAGGVSLKGIALSVIPVILPNSQPAVISVRIFYFLLIAKMILYIYASYLLTVTIGPIEPKLYLPVFYFYSPFVVFAEYFILLLIEVFQFIDNDIFINEDAPNSKVVKFHLFVFIVAASITPPFVYSIFFLEKYCVDMSVIYGYVILIVTGLFISFVFPALVCIFTGKRCFSTDYVS